MTLDPDQEQPQNAGHGGAFCKHANDQSWFDWNWTSYCQHTVEKSAYHPEWFGSLVLIKRDVYYITKASSPPSWKLLWTENAQ